jgi:hypothetical protein
VICHHALEIRGGELASSCKVIEAFLSVDSKILVMSFEHWITIAGLVATRIFGQTEGVH